MDISVIIPVYNAAPYVERAVLSALSQPETSEVILVEDCSPDDSLEVCRKLASGNQQIRLLQHPDGRNHGAGASRNLGILESSFEWIAFLDADDFFLPGRFNKTIASLSNSPSLDGVCEAVGVHFDTEQGRLKAKGTGHDALITFSHPVGPNEMFESLSPIGEVGYFHLNGFVVRRSAAIDGGLFSEMRDILWEDTEFAIRLAAGFRLATGEIQTPVALRGLHDANRITAIRDRTRVYCYRLKMWSMLFKWARQSLSGQRRDLVCRRICDYVGTPCDNINCRVRQPLQVLRQVFLITTYAPILWKCPGLHETLARHFVKRI